MKSTLRLACALAQLGLLPACSHPSDSDTAPVEQGETTAELLAQEQRAPEQYLQVSGTHRRNFLNQLVLEGDIANTATRATYKDPLLLVTWFSEAGIELGTKQYPLYELVRAQGSMHFMLKTEAPSYVAAAGMDIATATTVD
jgi:hypothetical protein